MMEILSLHIDLLIGKKEQNKHYMMIQKKYKPVVKTLESLYSGDWGRRMVRLKLALAA